MMPGAVTGRILLKTGAATACLVLLFTALTPVPHCTARDADGFPAKQKAFILELFNSKDYFSCIAETHRLLAYMPGSPARDDLFYFIEANYYLGGQYKTVISHLQAETAGQPLPGLSILLLSSSYMKLGMRKEGMKALSEADYAVIQEGLRHEFLIRRIEFNLADSHYGAALDEIEQARRAGLGGDRIESLALDLAGYTEIRRKSALGAASLSAVIPGSGQAYTGRFTDGAVSFLAMAALIAGTAVSYRGGEHGTAYTLGFFSALVYAGTVYGAWNAAGSFNRAAEAAFRTDITARHLPPYDPVKHIDLNGMFRQ